MSSYAYMNINLNRNNLNILSFLGIYACLDQKIPTYPESA